MELAVAAFARGWIYKVQHPDDCAVRHFSKKSTTNGQTDLILTLTPQIIRIPDITAADLEPVYVGTDSNISFQNMLPIEK